MPRFIIFYNGEEEKPEKEIMKLSDSYCEGKIEEIKNVSEDAIYFEELCKKYDIKR